MGGLTFRAGLNVQLIAEAGPKLNSGPVLTLNQLMEGLIVREMHLVMKQGSVTHNCVCQVIN